MIPISSNTLPLLSLSATVWLLSNKIASGIPVFRVWMQFFRFNSSGLRAHITSPYFSSIADRALTFSRLQRPNKPLANQTSGFNTFFAWILNSNWENDVWTCLNHLYHVLRHPWKHLLASCVCCPKGSNGLIPHFPSASQLPMPMAHWQSARPSGTFWHVCPKPGSWAWLNTVGIWHPLKSTSGYTKIYEVPINFKWRQPVSGWLGILCLSLPRCHMPSHENRRRVWSLSEFRCSVHGRRVRLYYQKKSAVWQELCQLSCGMFSQRYVKRKAQSVSSTCNGPYHSWEKIWKHDLT